MKLLFSYGSNHPQQLADRLGKRVTGDPAYAPEYERVFRGWSQNWGGGVASLRPKKDAVVYGYVSPVSEADLKLLDRYEGVATGNYRRMTLTVVVGEDPLRRGKKERAVAYVSRSDEFNEPTRAYLEAVAKTISSFWEEDDPITWKSIEVRRDSPEARDIRREKSRAWGRAFAEAEAEDRIRRRRRRR